MFDRILTGPVVREEVSRRGRRPKSEIAKAAAAMASGNSVNNSPLLANGLIPGMDISSYRALQQNFQNLQSLQLTAGLIGLPAGLSASGGDAKNMAAMFPMLLAGLPNLLGMGNLLNKTLEPSAKEKDEKHCANNCNEAENGKERTISPSGNKAKQNLSPPSTSMGSTLQAGSLSINPLLIPNILYPGMLLTPGLNLHIPAVPQANIFDVQNSSKDVGPVAVPDCTADPPPAPSQEEKAKNEVGSPNENSTDECSEKAEPSSGSNSPSSSSSDDSDSSQED